jgi:DNA/RNA-binding domain of Phe-tRNA-synthetase-like protein
VLAAFPGYRAGVVVAEGLRGPGVDAPPVFEPAALDHPHLLAWRDAFRAFGVKPKRAVCSAAALIVRGSSLPRINALVDRYNAVSMRWAVPVGGEDLDRVVPPVELRFASGDEPFDSPDEHPRRGEVVWVDGASVTCPRWNWRQCVRTRLTESTARAYFLFDALPVFSDAALGAAMDDLVTSLHSGWPAARLSSFVVAGPASTAAG